MRERIRVLRVVIGLNQGGVQQAVLNLFRGLDPARFEPIACAIENTGAIGKEIDAAGFEVVVLGYKRQPWRTVWALARLMRERQIGIVHASSYHPSLYARVAALLAGVPVVISHEHTIFDRNRPQRAFLNRLLQPFTDAYIAVSKAVARQVMDWNGYPPGKVHVIYNGVDTSRFRPAPEREKIKQQLGLDPARPVVGMISRLDPLKGHADFFAAISRLRPSFDAQWLVVGTGRGEEAVRRAAQEHGVTDIVSFLGLRRDVPELLAALDIYVLPTLKEGLSNSILECLSSGCASVVSDFPSNLEVVRDGHNALVVPMGDAERLTHAIRILLEDPGLRDRLGRTARADMVAGFSVVASVGQTAALYERLWHGKGRQ